MSEENDNKTTTTDILNKAFNFLREEIKSLQTENTQLRDVHAMTQRESFQRETELLSEEKKLTEHLQLDYDEKLEKQYRYFNVRISELEKQLKELKKDK